MPQSMHELSATDRAILEAFRAAENPPPGAARRVYAAVRDRVEAEEHDVPGPISRPPIPWLRSIALSVAIAAAVLLTMRGVVTGAAALREEARTAPAQAQHDVAGDAETSGEAQVAKPPKTTPPARASATSEPVPEAPALEEPAVPEPAPVAPASSPSRSSKSRAATEASDLAADLELLAEAKRTIDPTPRLALLTRHAKTHPGSTLSEERDVLLIETLCALGRTADAKTRATAFATRHPKSAFHARVSQSCARAPSTPG
jgi:hypothetical protein